MVDKFKFFTRLLFLLNLTSSLGCNSFKTDPLTLQSLKKSGSPVREANNPENEETVLPSEGSSNDQKLPLEEESPYIHPREETPQKEVVLFDNFESGALDKKWKPQTLGNVEQNKIEIDSATKFSGNGSLRFSTAAALPGKMQKANVTTSLQGTKIGSAKEFYGRAMLKIENAPAKHWSNISVSGKDKEGRHAILNFGGSYSGNFVANYYSPSPQEDCAKVAPAKPLWPLKKWFCLEWHYKKGTSQNPEAPNLTYWVNEVELMRVEGVGTCYAGNASMTFMPSFDEFSIGISNYHEAPPQNFWVDDLALSFERLGCPE